MGCNNTNNFKAYPMIDVLFRLNKCGVDMSLDKLSYTLWAVSSGNVFIAVVFLLHTVYRRDVSDQCKQ